MSTLGSLINSIQTLLETCYSIFQDWFNRLLPPKIRSEMLSKLQHHTSANPVLAVGLTILVLFGGVPLMLFTAFSIAVFFSSLLTGILVGLITALIFTAFVIGVALLILLPSLFLSFLGATFVFLQCACAYYLLKWFSNSRLPGSDFKSVGEKINRLTGGRTSGLTNAVHNIFAVSESNERETSCAHEKNTEIDTSRKLLKANSRLNHNGEIPERTSVNVRDGTQQTSDDSAGNPAV
ncbi:hypothetical protein P280DRAFT_430659 [Massarina eburnea CBS 473.64]|uniref:Uncharacterized protein n=1 Tax=Massarina eburnea CBS 473.64 TaxID=1395130 RepID=A0A6A6RTV3_9PLEO|nr:hypothetical protein P280DRAFT_430659 [Massarina eburnea CBS 473.64]